MSDLQKYINIYTGSSYFNRHGEGYGRKNWGEAALDYFKTANFSSLLDVGCGYGNFCYSVSPYVEKLYGADIASVRTGNVRENEKVTYIDAESHSIPMPDDSVECITSFDVLEHVLPENVDATFEEFFRIATKIWVFCISSVHDSHDGVPYHMTVQPLEWWKDKISKYADIEELYAGPNRPPYLVCKLKK